MSLEQSYRDIGERSARGARIDDAAPVIANPRSASTALLSRWILAGHGAWLAEALTASPPLPSSPRGPTAGNAAGQIMKRLLDVAVAGTTLVLLSPLLLATALLVAVSLGRPIIFSHERVGCGGRTFRCYKFPSLVAGAEVRLAEVLAKDPALAAEWRETQKLQNDPRVTSLGRILRRTSIDELPQLFNVLKGDMSCVGPRPVTAEELKRYGDRTNAYLSLRPGLTGLWQVSGRSSLSYQARVELDAIYAERQSVLLDLATLVRTIPVLCRTQDSA